MWVQNDSGFPAVVEVKRYNTVAEMSELKLGATAVATGGGFKYGHKVDRRQADSQVGLRLPQLTAYLTDISNTKCLPKPADARGAVRRAAQVPRVQKDRRGNGDGSAVG